MTRDLAVEQQPTWNGSPLNCPVQVLPSKVSSHPGQGTNHDDAYNCPCLVSDSTISFINNIILLMSVHHSIRSCSPCKSVFGKIEDTYQAYCNTYKMHTMATHNRGIGHLLDKDTDLNREDPETAEMEIENTHGFDATVALN